MLRKEADVLLGVLNKLVNAIYPAKCIFCQQLLEYDADLHICSGCYSRLPFMDEALPTLSQSGGKSHYDSAVSVFRYTGMVKESLIRFKFYNKPSYYRTYARLMADRLAKKTGANQYDVVLSVPLHKLREFSRGYNQAFLISRALSRELKLPEYSSLLKRIRSTDTQSLLDRQERHRNVRGAFFVAVPEKVKGKSILLVDDILTTGSTLEECSKVLRQAGALKIIAVVVATGKKY